MSACAALSPDSFAAAVPEVIELTDDERAGPAGAALDHEQTKFRSLLSEGEYDAALESAKLAVALTSQVWGTESNQLGQALTNLAIAQTEVNNFPAAQQNFEAAIRVYEQAERSLVSSELINPLRGLADTQIAMSQYEAAIPLFERAIHISHVTDGPTNLQQIQDMDALSRAHFFSGSAARATSIQEKMYRLQQRKFSANSEGYAEALDRRANWFTEIGDFTQATYTLRRLERVLGETYGRDDPRLIPVLIRLSFVANKQADGPTTLTPEIAEKEARRAINRAVRIARTQAEDNPQLLARTLTQRGDFLLTTNAVRSASGSYREALQIINEHPEFGHLKEQWFGAPRIVEREPIEPVYHRNSGGQAAGTYPDRGYVTVTYDTNSVGRPIRVRVIDSQPAGLMDYRVMRKVRRFVYRPQYENGNPVVGRGLVYRHDYRYDERRLMDGEKESIAKQERARAKQAAQAQAARDAEAAKRQAEATESFELAEVSQPVESADANDQPQSGDIEAAAQLPEQAQAVDVVEQADQVEPGDDAEPAEQPEPLESSESDAPQPPVTDIP